MLNFFWLKDAETSKGTKLLLRLAFSFVFLMIPSNIFARGVHSDKDLYLQVVVTSAPVYAGPGGSFDEIARVGNKEVFLANAISPEGTWYRIRLARGINGWIWSELVWPFQISSEEDASSSQWIENILSKKSILDDFQISMSVEGGLNENHALFMVRTGFHFAKAYWLETSIGQSLSRFGSSYQYHAEILTTVGSFRTLVPFAGVGAGGQTSISKAEDRLFLSKTLPTIHALIGLLWSFEGFALRLNFQRLASFSSQQSFGSSAVSVGLMVPLKASF